MHSERCELSQTCREMSQLIFFLIKTLFLRHTSFDEYKSGIPLYIYICCLLSVFPSNSVRICPIKLKIGILYHMNNTFQNTTFKEKIIKVMKGKGIIMKLNKVLVQHSLITICKSFVRCHINYGDVTTNLVCY